MENLAEHDAIQFAVDEEIGCLDLFCGRVNDFIVLKECIFEVPATPGAFDEEQEGVLFQCLDVSEQEVHQRQHLQTPFYPHKRDLFLRNRFLRSSNDFHDRGLPLHLDNFLHYRLANQSPVKVYRLELVCQHLLYLRVGRGHLDIVQAALTLTAHIYQGVLPDKSWYGRLQPLCILYQKVDILHFVRVIWLITHTISSVRATNGDRHLRRRFLEAVIDRLVLQNEFTFVVKLDFDVITTRIRNQISQLQRLLLLHLFLLRILFLIFLPFTLRHDNLLFRHLNITLLFFRLRLR